MMDFNYIPTADALPCGCHIGPWWGVTPPPRCPAHENGGKINPPIERYTMPWPFRVSPLADADVERIAKRVVEMLRETKP